MRTLGAVPTVLLILSPCVVLGDDLGAAARGAACSAVGDSLERLVCFDRAFPRQADVTTTEANAASPDGSSDAPEAAADAPVSDPVPMVQWSVEVSKSAIDDSPSVFAMLLPETQSGTGIGGAEVALLLRCAENTTSVILSTTMFMTEESVPVTIRIGDAPARRSGWTLSSSNKAVGLWSGSEAIPFIRSLPDNARLVIRIDERDRIDAQFNLANVSKVAAQIADACHWPSPGGAKAPKGDATPAELGIQ